MLDKLNKGIEALSVISGLDLVYANPSANDISDLSPLYSFENTTTMLMNSL